MNKWKDLVAVARSKPNGEGNYPNGLRKLSPLQEYSQRVLVDLECRAESADEDPDSEYGQLYDLRKEYYLKAWVERN